jgi:hydroxymethylglutaryl-CoA synthase
MSVPSPAEDSISMALTAFSRLLRRHSLDANQIGRLEVGSESNPDRAKSIKSHLMSLISTDGQFARVAGADCVQACYGGSAAYLNALAWLSSPLWSEKRPLAVVIASDVAVYSPGPARATGGAAAIALLLGRVPATEAAIRCDLNPIGNAAGHVYDFYKAAPGSEYPQVDGPLSVDCYLRSVEVSVFDYFSGALPEIVGDDVCGLDSTTTATTTTTTSIPDVLLFHTPFSKIAHKALKRLRVPSDVEEASLKSLHLTTLLGNSYCASLYVNLLFCLIQLMKSSVGAGGDEGKEHVRLLMVSYGSGLMASAFGITVRPERFAQWLPAVADQLASDLADRIACSAQEFEEMLRLREAQFAEPKGWISAGDMIEGVRGGAYYLQSIDEQLRRNYLRK